VLLFIKLVVEQFSYLLELQLFAKPRQLHMFSEIIVAQLFKIQVKLHMFTVVIVELVYQSTLDLEH
jgi:hypothetical protein